MGRWYTVVVLASVIVALCGCDRTVSESVPLSYDNAVARLQGVVTNRPGTFLEWIRPTVTVIGRPSAQCRLTMSRNWTRSSKFEYAKMIDDATVIFTPNGQTQTLVVVTVLSRNAFGIGKGEPNRKAEKDLAQQLYLLFYLLFKNTETFEPSVGR